ncbi:MAG: hypothetical protein WAM97_09540 [Acidimicrobiales bacterium]
MSSAGSPDPLGRRSLFWATGTVEEGSRVENRPLGKLAFYSEASSSGGRSSDKHSSDIADGASERSSVAGSAKKAVRSAVSGIEALSYLAPVTVECSKCKTTSEVPMHQFFALHLPIWLWRPGRGYTRLMTCPSCRRRAWLSASWRPWSN